jgi:hypothetical protein
LNIEGNTMSEMTEVTKHDANNYCRVLRVLGMDEEGDPVAKIESLMSGLTADDALKLLADRAQWCRENGETDMRNILNTVHGIKSMIAEGKSRAEILEALGPDEDEDEDA